MGYYYRLALDSASEWREMWSCAALSHLLADEDFLNSADSELCARYLCMGAGVEFVDFSSTERAFLSYWAWERFKALRDNRDDALADHARRLVAKREREAGRS
jgi:hypothetical protein